MVALNCAAVPDSLLESELFGHVRGSFTGAYRDKPGLLELAQSGTIFLDEIGETSLRMQALMLRFLENGEIWRVGANERARRPTSAWSPRPIAISPTASPRASSAPTSTIGSTSSRSDPAAARAPRGHPAVPRSLPAACIRTGISRPSPS